MKKLSEEFNSIAVKKGELFAVELNGNASTGYLWEVKITEGDASIVSQRYIPHSSDPMIVGGGSVERTVYRAETAGQIEIQAEWKRPWESGPPAKKAVFKINVS